MWQSSTCHIPVGCVMDDTPTGFFGGIMKKVLRFAGKIVSMTRFMLAYYLRRFFCYVYRLTDREVVDVQIGANPATAEVSLKVILKNGDSVFFAMHCKDMKKVAYRIRDVCDTLDVDKQGR